MRPCMLHLIGVPPLPHSNAGLAGAHFQTYMEDEHEGKIDFPSVCAKAKSFKTVQPRLVSPLVLTAAHHFFSHP